jgi:hypothetical protein
MRIVGPRQKFELWRRVEGAISADGQAVNWESKGYIYGIPITLSGAEGRYNDKIGVRASLRLYINGCDITEEDILKKDGVEYDIVFVDNKFLKNKILAVDLS